MAAYAELKRGTKAKAIRLPSALVVDDTVTLTRTDVVAQRVVRVEASQTTIVRTLQRRSAGDSSQQLTKLGRPIIKEWEPDFRLQYEYESFRFSATNERWRKTIWTKWTNRRRSLFYAVSTVARHRLMEIWRTEEPNETVSWRTAGSTIRRKTATCTKILARLINPCPCVMKGGRGSTNHRAVNPARVAGNTKGDSRGPTRLRDKPGQPRATPENWANVVKRNNKEDADQQPLCHGSRLRDPAPIPWHSL